MASTDPLSYVSSTRAFAYLAERGEDALYAVKEALSSGSTKYLDTDTGTIRKLLESSHDAERLEGLKHVLAMISKGLDPTIFLASVFKLASTTSFEVRKLVYIIVLRYAGQHPDLALLSINSIQRDLTEPNPMIRAMALRTLSEMRVKDAFSITILAIAKAVRDSHPYVRRVAAYAILRCYEMDPDTRDTLNDPIETLLRDRSPEVLGPTIRVFATVNGDRWDAFHRHFRKMCHALSDMDPWSQSDSVDVLVRYARLHLPDPQTTTDMDPDLELLVNQMDPLLSSIHAAPVMSAVRATLLLAPEDRHKKAISALVQLLRKPADIAYVAILRILAVEQKHVPLLEPFLGLFFIRVNDPEYLALAKLRVLLLCVQPSNAETIADELAVYTRSDVCRVAVESVTALGQVACHSKEYASHCIKRLLIIAQDTDVNEQVRSRAVQVIRMLMVTPDMVSDKLGARIVVRFALRLFVPLAKAGIPAHTPMPTILLDPSSRAAVLWMLGHYAQKPLLPETDTCPARTFCELLIPDMLRCLVGHWHKEHTIVQCQSLSLSAKAFIVAPTLRLPAERSDAIKILHYALLSLGTQSDDPDVRDRARFYGSLTRKMAPPDQITDPSEADLDQHVKDFFQQHEGLDQWRLPGIRLRRSQVEHVLFQEQTHKLIAVAPHLTLATPKLSMEAIPTLTEPIFLRGSTKFQVLPWKDASQLPPSIIRIPEVESSYTQQPNLRSITSESSQSQIHSGPLKSERVVLTPREVSTPPRTSAYNARYATLDTFFDDDDQDSDAQISLDAQAPEDDDLFLMPKAPSSQRRGARPDDRRPLGQDIQEDQLVSRFGRVRTQKHRSKQSKHEQEQDAEPEKLRITGSRAGQTTLDPKSSRTILRLAREQQEEVEREEDQFEAEDTYPSQNYREDLALQDDEDGDDEDASLSSEAGEDYEMNYTDLDIQPEDHALLEQHDQEQEQAMEEIGEDGLPRPRTKTLADLIMAKIDAAESGVGSQAHTSDDDGRMMPPGINPKVIEVYSKVGQLLSRYKSGPLPKAFKIIPSLPAWEDILYITNPETWTPHATLAATRIFVSNFKPAQCERYYQLVFYDKIRDEIRDNKKVSYQMYEAIKKSLYKPAAFFKGILFPLCDGGGVTLKEAAIIGSVLSKVSIPVLHSAAALLRLAEMEYSGPNSLFIRILLDKKYALPYKVIDALVYHFLQFADASKGVEVTRTRAGVVGERRMPVLWHQSLLVFAQRYKSDLTPDQKIALLDLIRVQRHPGIEPDIRRELTTGESRGELLPEPLDDDEEMSL
ncbi:snoRNA-binding rRNA-processing protein [Malassezia yamatoensis]|uniref:SnoRNA-binding rRNA-processing protein n=1 Tax=Malassezia yamatoensis TaxID=253288 RepID=A0AAJ5YRK4_9BASI|nr:snoRNA-binding rRNA-processing protein [Malassezia yamatoensis]